MASSGPPRQPSPTDREGANLETLRPEGFGRPRPDQPTDIRAEPPTQTPASKKDGPHKFPGLADSVPFFIVGGVFLAYGLWLALSHSTESIGRFTLELPTLGVGSMLLVGGIVGSFLEDEDTAPTRETPRDRSYIKVPSREWSDLRAEVRALKDASLGRGAAPTGAAEPGSGAGTAVVVSPSGRDVSDGKGRIPAPWDEDTELPASAPRMPFPSRERAEAILMEAEAVARELRPQVRSSGTNTPVETSSLPLANTTPDDRTSTRGQNAGSPTGMGPSDRSLPRVSGLLPAPGQPASADTAMPPAEPRGPPDLNASAMSVNPRPPLGKCSSCGRGPGRGAQLFECISCGRPLCTACREANLKRWELPVCKECGGFLASQ
jgi:hypothetical protein